MNATAEARRSLHRRGSVYNAKPLFLRDKRQFLMILAQIALVFILAVSTNDDRHCSPFFIRAAGNSLL